MLNEKLTRHRTFDGIKEELLTTKANILKKLHDNIVDQVDTESIFYLLSIFDLKSREKCKKLRGLYEIYGKDKIHLVDQEWFEFKVTITYKPKLKCSYDELEKQFKIGHEKNDTSRTRSSRRSGDRRYDEPVSVMGQIH